MENVDWIALIVLIIHILLALAAAVYVSANRKPESAIAWIMAVIFIPLIGIVFFALVGAQRLPRHRREKQAFVSDSILARTEGGPGVTPSIVNPIEGEPNLLYLSVTDISPCAHNTWWTDHPPPPSD